MNSYDIAVLAGDGIGPEVVEATLAVLRKVDARHSLGLGFTELRAGAFAYRDTGTDLSDEVFDRARKADAILLGAMGWPGIRHADGTELAPQITLRQRLDLFGGVRPIRAIPGVPLPLVDPRAAKIDFVILRESTEGLFFSKDKGVVTRDQAEETLRMTRGTSLRLARMAFDLAGQRARRLGRSGRVTLVDKANVFRAFAWLRQIFQEVAVDYPEVRHDAAYVDAMALDLIRRPWDFDLLPTENMFGDILSDLAAGLIGGMGFAPSADLGEGHAVFQPSHGTAPDIAGKGKANPTATILSAAMMLEWLAMRDAGDAMAEAAQEIRAAVDAAFSEGLRTADIGGTSGTAEATRAVLSALR
ncbi:isocitrate/isopropylmalate dehydrogenase family protein [Roseococcus pinisoli]|uniref:3-isopropylmalate dehydrogenase n=1 Tax=Roseococcus pinisoli TaxID=2835040 RepID=A0ABS5QHY2_9PROT|nr:isocitrate/isopropylmalate dehydrogenase family protein [Roseococcus pinisoli]MBS7812527.1 isocitrate/isopropylmalate dehydrogenase family protein [Roseococcus pinisoli]